jgi:MBG domain (YGX type)/Carboxypeptidase regulatory-like domain/Bacterial Ig-like domain (group 3)
MKTDPQSTSTSKTVKQFLFRRRRGSFAVLVTLAMLATALTVVSISSAKSKKAQAKRQTASKRSAAGPLLRKKGPGLSAMGANGQESGNNPTALAASAKREQVNNKATESRLTRAKPFDGDLRGLPYVKPIPMERPDLEEPARVPRAYVPPGRESASGPTSTSAPELEAPTLSAPAPAPLATFEGLDNATWGAGHPPDTVGDVGPNHYIQSINSSVGIYDKSTGVRLAAFTLNTFMSQGHFGNVCDTNNFGDPVVLYDTFEDRWMVSDFAFILQGNGANPNPGAFQCLAVSKTGDPVSGGWNFYSTRTDAGLGDYPKFGVWTDGIYMTVDIFSYGSTPSFVKPQVFAFNKAQMYAGAPTVQVAVFDMPSSEFAPLPSNARLQTGTPPPGTPNYVAVVWQFLNLFSVYKTQVNWNSISTSSLTGPFSAVSNNWWEQLAAANQTAPTPANRNDELYARLMMQNQYTNIGGVESLWAAQTCGVGNPGAANVTATQASVRYYQVKINGGSVEPTASQAWTYTPGDNLWKYMPSLAVDRAGNMAIGYTTSNAATHPAIKYAGRLATDPNNSITQDEQTLFQGTGSQAGNCGGAACTRWGDYSAMSLDPDGCTLWYTNMYYAAPNSLNHQTRIGSFKFSQCTPVGNGGTISGVVTADPGGATISGATVTLGSRTTMTDGSGNYSFSNLPAGTYSGMTASYPGRNGASATSIVVTDANITTQDFSLTASPVSGCLVDTTQADFQMGIPTTVDLTGTPGSVRLTDNTDTTTANLSVTNSGFGLNSTSWVGQTFTPNVSGSLTRVDVDLFCSGCTGTTPNLTLSIRNTSGDLPTGADLATATIPGFSTGAGGYFAATLVTPLNVTAGTRYAFVLRSVANPSAGTYAYVVSSTNIYANGRWVTSSNSGGTWAGATTGTPPTSRDLGFVAFIKTGFGTTGNLISGVKDANPPVGANPTWGTLSWSNAALPAGTNIQFQAAASNNPAGVFNFVGPNGTAATFFTNGQSLAQFNGFRYLKYKAILTSSNSANTPTLNDVTVCFANQLATTLTADPATGTYGGTVNLSATLTDGSNGLSGKTVAFTLNGASAGSGTTDANGVATVSNASLAGINGGSYPTGVGASFAGDAGYLGSSATAALTVNQADQTITFNALGDKTFGDADFNVSATASSGLPVSFSAAGNCTVLGSTVHITGAGSCTITASQLGNGNYNAAPNVDRTFSINQASSTTTITCPPSVTYSGGAQTPCTAKVTGAGGLDQALSISYSNNTFVGTATADASYLGDVNHTGSSDSKNFQITKAVLTVTAQAASRQYSDPNPTFTYNITGFVGTDTAAVVSGAPALTTTANSSSVAGTYPINIALGTLSAANYSFTLVGNTLTVTTESAKLEYTGDSLVATSKAGGSTTVKLSALVTEDADGYLGNTLGGKTVQFTITGTTGSPTVVTAIINGTTRTAMTSVSLKADNYTIELELLANNQYSAEIEEAIVTVVDPGTGLATGGGWIVDPEGGRGHFGFTVKFLKNGNPQGNNIYIHLKSLDLAALGIAGAPAGVRSYNIIFKSNSMSAMTSTTTAPLTAQFTGKNTIKAVDRLTGLTYSLSGAINYNFQVDVTDNEDSSPDTYALRVWTTTGNYKVVGTYLPSGLNTAQVALQGGNIQVK